LNVVFFSFFNEFFVVLKFNVAHLRHDLLDFGIALFDLALALDLGLLLRIHLLQDQVSIALLSLLSDSIAFELLLFIFFDD
jgi:hypothetical protein